MKKITLTLLLIILALSIFAQDPYGNKPITSYQIDGNQLKVTYKIPEGFHQTAPHDYFYVDIEKTTGITFDETVLPPAEMHEGLMEYKNSVTLTKKFTTSKNFTESTIVKVFAGMQYCLDTGACFPPQEEILEIKGSEFLANNPVETEKSDSLAKSLKFLLFAFLGGVLLNVMPCVLPVLSIKAMSIVKQSQQDRKQILKSSFAYTFGIVASFAVLATVVVILKMSGEMVGWGFQFQNAGFVFGLAIMMFVFALSLFDLFTFSAPGMQTASKASAKGGLTGSFLSGVFAVLLATPCTAPLLGAALGFAFSQPPIMIFVFFILIGIGLAFPFILLGLWPKAIKALPKPGNWMNIFKEAMGFLLFATVVFLLRTLNLLIGSSNFINVLWYLVVLGFATWIYGMFNKPHISHKKQWIWTIVALVIAIGGGMLLVDLKQPTTENGEIINSTLHEGWGAFSEEKVATLREEGKPVFIDFGAEWCMTCKTNEKTVLFTKEITQEFKAYDVTLLKGDNTKKNPIIAKWLKKFDRAGVPLYVLYAPGSEKPVVLPEIITKGMVKKMLEENLTKVVE